MIRRLLIFAAATLAAGTITTGGTAMATKGSCDPAPDPYNVIQIQKANGAVFVEVGYGWDGVSIFPACAGPIMGARVRNSSGQDWFARFPKANGGVRVITIAANSTRTYTQAQLSSVGLDTLAEINDLKLFDTPQ